MKSSQNIPKAFVAGAFTPAFNGSFDDATKTRLQEIIAGVRDAGVPLFSSHEAEDWGAELARPTSLVPRDLHHLESSTHFIVYIGPVSSIGIFIELGYVIARGYPVLAIVDVDADTHSDFLKGMVEIGLIRWHQWSTPHAMRAVIREFLSQRESRATWKELRLEP